MKPKLARHAAQEGIHDVAMGRRSSRAGFHDRVTDGFRHCRGCLPLGREGLSRDFVDLGTRGLSAKQPEDSAGEGADGEAGGGVRGGVLALDARAAVCAQPAVPGVAGTVGEGSDGKAEEGEVRRMDGSVHSHSPQSRVQRPGSTCLPDVTEAPGQGRKGRGSFEPILLISTTRSEAVHRSAGPKAVKSLRLRRTRSCGRSDVCRSP
jgi:hypothetical protein